MHKEIKEWKQNYETLSKQSQDMNAMLIAKDKKIAELEQQLNKEKNNYLELVLKTDSSKQDSKEESPKKDKKE